MAKPLTVVEDEPFQTCSYPAKKEGGKSKMQQGRQFKVDGWHWATDQSMNCKGRWGIAEMHEEDTGNLDPVTIKSISINSIRPFIITLLDTSGKQVQCQIAH